jgi:photosystem II stability/assembly factor-like uncharacterized protein
MRFFSFLLLTLTFSVHAQWKTQTIESKASFRAIDRINKDTAWLSGSKGSILKSMDGGETWKNVCPEAYKNFDFRGIAVLDSKETIAMSAGDGSEGKAFCIKTTDGGQTWKVILKKKEKGVFFDTIKFKNSKIGFILGDPIDSKPYLLQTLNGGQTWERVQNLPDILVGEASFAASNSCISILRNQVWFNTQNRIFHSKNSGKTWEVLETPFETTQSRGIFGTFFLDKNLGLIVGGDYTDDKNLTLQYAYSHNQGEFWKTTQEFYRNGLTECISTISKNQLISVGTIGTAVSVDNGQNWRTSDKDSFHVVSCKDKKCIAAGGNGKIGIWNFGFAQ